MSEDQREHVVHVLLSGGLDSATCAAFYLDQDRIVQAWFVNYGQRARAQEESAAIAIAEHYDLPMKISSWAGCKKDAGAVRARNAFLLSAVLMELPPKPSLVAIGIHHGTPYGDCTPEFIAAMETIAELSAPDSQIAAPFLEWTKPDVFGLANRLGVPLGLTYSCELGLDQPCGLCESCRDLERLYAGA